ncbi:UDP-N-acetylglucosamine 2-epimerase [Lentibacillus saliphilus]|uniref:UDP-N-acetylglucosamine 2-epimerase n=1 Tax=Lentibacillus saliphilus TaxID=2737028 RepID=UPI001C30A55E
MDKRKICVVTGTRAEYGLLYWLMRQIQSDPDLELQLIVTGMHLSPEFGLTYKEIEKDGFVIDEKVEMLLSSDTSVGTVKSLGMGVVGFADSLSRLQPDIVVILGDRFEALAGAQSAMILKIPIAHIHGGEITHGAYDDSIRHAITKMSTFHFVTTEEHRQRVIRLGEHYKRVHNVGALGVETIKKMNLYTKQDIEGKLMMKLNSPLLLITHHPTTLASNPCEGTNELLEALNEFKDATFIFTKANADSEGRRINEMINDFVAQNPHNSRLFDSLGQRLYTSVLKIADAVVGNSSSGLLEAAYVNTPTVNIGNRQKGRARPNSVIDCAANPNEITLAIRKALSFKFNDEGLSYRIFGEGETSVRIKDVLKQADIKSTVKAFYDGGIV